MISVEDRRRSGACCARFLRACGNDPVAAGTRIWIAAGVTDLRRGFDGLVRKCRPCSTNNHSPVMSSHFEGAEANIVKLYGGTAMGYAYFPSALSAGDSSGQGGERNCLPESRTAVDAAGRDRLEKT